MSQSFPYSQVGSQFPSQSQAGTQSRALPRCPECGSRRWRKDASRGSIICEEGHVLAGYVQESNEITGSSQHQLTRRKLRKGKRERKERARRDAYHGERAKFLLLQALTMMLRQQVAAMRGHLKAPEELETVTRRFWEIYLGSIVLERDALFPVDEPGSQAAVGSDDDGPVQSGSGARDKTVEQMLEDEISTGSDSDSSDAPSDSSDGSEDDPRTDRGSERSSDSDGRQRKRRRRENIYEADPRVKIRPIYTLAILYLACIHLCLPVIMNDIVRMVTNKRLPYLRYYYALPAAMRAKVNRANRFMLSNPEPPSVYRGRPFSLSYYCDKMLGLLRQEAPDLLPSPLPGSTEGTLQPDIRVILSRFCEAMLLPDFMHQLSSHLLSLLPRSYLIPRALPPTLSRSGPGFAKKYAAPVDFVVMATLVVAAKLVYGLGQDWTPRNQDLEDDETVRQVREEWGVKAGKRVVVEARAKVPDLGKWLDALQQAGEVIDTDDPRRLWEMDLADMRNEEIDQYLDFCEGFLLTDERDVADEAFHRRWFPIPNTANRPAPSPSHLPPRPTLASLRASLDLHPASSVADSDPGDGPSAEIEIFATDDPSGELPGSLRCVLGRACVVVGASEEVLLVVMARIEHKLEAAAKQLSVKGKDSPEVSVGPRRD